MNILIVKTSAIGDVVHTLPALNAIRKKYPEAKIDWLVEEAAADAVIGHKAIGRVLVSKRKQWIKDWRVGRLWQAFNGFFSFVKKLRSTKYDLLIDFQSLLKSSVFVFLARAEIKAGFGRGMDHAECSYLFLNKKIPPVDMNQHALERELKLLGGIGIEHDEIVFNFPIDENHRTDVDDLLLKSDIAPDKPFVAINPMTTWETKHWYDERFVAVAQKLIAQGVGVVFTGGKSDVAGIDKLCAQLNGKVANLAGQTSLNTLAVVFEKAKVVITTDTGPMHVAAAVNTPVVALFGPTAPWRTGPYGDQHKILQVEMECRPCLKKNCGTRICMREITAEQVLVATNEILQRS